MEDAIRPTQVKLPPMKAILILMLLAACVTPAPAQQMTAAKDIDSEPDFIFIQEIGMWKALQSHDLGTFESLLLPDYIEVDKTIQTREQLMANLNVCTIVSFKLRNHQTRMLSPDAAVIAYSGSSEINCRAAHIASNYKATTTWGRRHGKWLVPLPTQIPLQPPTRPT